MSTLRHDIPKTPALEWILRGLAALGLGASLLLLWEYTASSAPLCAVGAGCDLVRASRWAFWAGVPTPAFGVVFFVFVLGLALLPSPQARSVLTLVGAAGAVGALGFILLMTIEVRAFCPYCVMVDLSAVALALIVLANRSPRPPMATSSWWAVAGLVVLCGGAPFAFAIVTRPPPTPAHTDQPPPECVLREQTPGPITIVEFLDFQCPHCRMQHFELSRIIDDFGDELGRPIRVVRRHFPLGIPGHERSPDAARAAICAEDAGRGDLMADLLFAAEDFSPAAIEASALQLGMQPGEYRACVTSAATARRLEDDMACGQAAAVEALPTIYIDSMRFEGRQQAEKLVTALRRAADIARGTLPGAPP